MRFAWCVSLSRQRARAPSRARVHRLEHLAKHSTGRAKTPAQRIDHVHAFTEGLVASVLDALFAWIAQRNLL